MARDSSTYALTQFKRQKVRALVLTWGKLVERARN
jgi:hypothetical protein